MLSFTLCQKATFLVSDLFFFNLQKSQWLETPDCVPVCGQLTGSPILSPDPISYGTVLRAKASLAAWGYLKNSPHCSNVLIQGMGWNTLEWDIPEQAFLAPNPSTSVLEALWPIPCSPITGLLSGSSVPGSCAIGVALPQIHCYGGGDVYPCRKLETSPSNWNKKSANIAFKTLS